MAENIDELLLKMRHEYQQKTNRVDGFVVKIQAAVNAYKQAVVKDIVNGMAKKLYDGDYEPQAPEAADAVLELVAQLPEFGGQLQISWGSEDSEEAPVPDEGDTEDAPQTFADDNRPYFPHLIELSKQKPILVYGGTALHDRIAWLQKLDLNVEWAPAHKKSGRSRDVESAVARILNNTVLTVFYVKHFAGHVDGSRVKDAAKKAGVPLFDAYMAGQGQLLRVLKDAEAKFTPKP